MPYTENEQGHAGCVASAVESAAGCVAETEEASQIGQMPALADASAGCAESSPPETLGRQAQPPATVREFERALRGLGFTRAQAQAIARGGFGALQASACADPPPDEDPSIAAALLSLAASFKD